MSLLGTIERDLSLWEDATSKELAALVQTFDQVFVDWDQMILASLGSNPADALV